MTDQQMDGRNDRQPKSFFFVINYFISETTSYNIYKHDTFYHTQVLSSHTVK